LQVTQPILHGPETTMTNTKEFIPQYICG